jgi:CBS domain-containing protein
MTAHPAPRPHNDDLDDVIVHLDEVAVEAVRRMLDEGVERFSVVNDENVVVGVCSLSDIVKARASRFDHETVQRGWLPPMLARHQNRQRDGTANDSS